MDLPLLNLDADFPSFPSVGFQTEAGTHYLMEPGIALIAKPQVDLEALQLEFLDGFDVNLNFNSYIDDADVLEDGEQLAKVAGQLCYLSFGPKRTYNKDAAGYFQNILESGHGSVLEHPNYSFLIWGISRSLTHEFVRHRVGFAYSQVSQRYVDGTKLRFVMRPEFQTNDVLRNMFFNWIDAASSEYNMRAKLLLEEIETKAEEYRRAGKENPWSKTDLRKLVNQSARACLPNETEAPLIVTGNARSLRHFLNMRGSFHAESEIAKVAVLMASILKAQKVAPLLFPDVEAVERDGRIGLELAFKKP